MSKLPAYIDKITIRNDIIYDSEVIQNDIVNWYKVYVKTDKKSAKDILLEVINLTNNQWSYAYLLHLDLLCLVFSSHEEAIMASLIFDTVKNNIFTN